MATNHAQVESTLNDGPAGGIAAGEGRLASHAPSFDALVPWGWDARWAEAFEAAPAGLRPARVVAQHRGQSVLAGPDGDLAASPSGRFRHDAEENGLPTVGDWLAYRAGSPAARIEMLLPRRSAFFRRAAGSRPGVQLIAANVDTLLLATSLNADLNVRRLERYVAMARESGAQAVVLLTKSDLAPDAATIAASLEGQLGVPAVAVSARTGGGFDGLGPWLAPGRTIALVGSSGVGKSTLVNVLAGTELMATREIREDDSRGRHTTSHRELFRLPSGVLVLDTPGMRELGLWDADSGVEDTFGEIARLAAECRFADCRHEREPGCAVQEAIARGGLDEKRLRSYRRLSRELAEQPAPATRREAERRFARVVRNGSAESTARKTYREEW